MFADALIAVQCAGVALDFWDIVAGRMPIRNLLFPDLLWHTTRPSWARGWDRLEIAMIAGTFVCGGTLAPFLMRFLSKCTGCSLSRFLMSSAVAGVVYAWAVASLALGIVSVVNISASSVGANDDTIPPLLWPLSAALFVFGVTVDFAPIFAPPVVLVGGVVGMLNGMVVRRAWGHGRLLV